MWGDSGSCPIFQSSSSKEIDQPAKALLCLLGKVERSLARLSLTPSNLVLTAGPLLYVRPTIIHMLCVCNDKAVFVYLGVPLAFGAGSGLPSSLLSAPLSLCPSRQIPFSAFSAVIVMPVALVLRSSARCSRRFQGQLRLDPPRPTCCVAEACG